MEQKKSPQADIDSKTTIFRQVGFIFALLVIIVAFQWNFGGGGDFMLVSDVQIEEEEEIADITKQVEPPPPPPPPEIDIVDDDVEIEDDQPDLFETDLDDDFVFEIPDDEPGEVVDEDEIHTVVQDRPQFPGGDGKLFEYLQENIIYPNQERNLGIGGNVVVTFVVNTDGSITDIAILQGVSPNLNREAIRVVTTMPRWEPGRQRGREVRVQVNLPITFRIRN